MKQLQQTDLKFTDQVAKPNVEQNQHTSKAELYNTRKRKKEESFNLVTIRNPRISIKIFSKNKPKRFRSLENVNIIVT